MVSVADCERVQADWFRVRAELGGRTWVDDGHLLTDGPDGFNVMFPAKPSAPVIGRAIEYAVENGRPSIGAWLSLDADPEVFAEAGFERGWAPWWMVADLADVGAADDGRIVLAEPPAEDRPAPATAWYAAAYLDARFAGQAWSYLDGDLAGVFDMAVWPRFRRRGLGTGLLRRVCASAREAGAAHAILNATPEGKLLYSTCGFEQIGEGITYWLHLAPRTLAD